jgi:ceramide glucosyltransferase
MFFASNQQPGEQVVGVNPKINNLMKPYHTAKYDILWVLDSNVQILPDALARSVDALNRPLQRRVGLVHHVPIVATYELTAEIGTRIEQAFLNTNHAKMYIALNTFAIDSCVMGKSNMYRRSDVDRLTGTLRPTVSKPSLELTASELTASEPTASEPTPMGFAVFGKYLAEDNMLASALWHELGLRHDLGSDVAVNSLGSMSFGAYASRRARWIRVRKWMTFAATLLEPFSESVFVGILVSLALSHLTHRLIRPWMFFPMHMLAFLAIDLSVRNTLVGEPLHGEERWAFIRAWAMREIMAFPIWLFAIFGNEVDWRGRKYRILRNGETRRVEKAGWRTRIGRRIRNLFTGRPEGYEPIGGE